MVIRHQTLLDGVMSVIDLLGQVLLNIVLNRHIDELVLDVLVGLLPEIIVKLLDASLKLLVHTLGLANGVFDLLLLLVQTSSLLIEILKLF